MPKLMEAEGQSDPNDSYSCPEYSYPEIFAINNLSNNDWRNPIVDYLENPSYIVSRKTKYRALSYVIIENELFKTDF